MNNTDILDVAMKQSAVDSNCRAEDFKSYENKIVLSKNNSDARRYLELPFYCDLTSYGKNIVASVSDEISEIVREYINKFSVAHCFETPNLNVLMEQLKPFNFGICFMAEYFLPDLTAMPRLNCCFETRVLKQTDLSDLYLPEWGNALSENRKNLDVLAVGAFDDDKLIGLAGCSADCDTMWQIGVDVLPQYRNMGVASSLTNKLMYEILDRNIVPFYCCAWSNIGSKRNAIKSGFRPAWVQVTAKSLDFISSINKV